MLSKHKGKIYVERIYYSTRSKKETFALFALPLAVLGAEFAFPDHPQKSRIHLLHVVASLGRCLHVRALPFCRPGFCLFHTDFAQLNQIGLVAHQDEWDLKRFGSTKENKHSF